MFVFEEFHLSKSSVDTFARFPATCCGTKDRAAAFVRAGFAVAAARPVAWPGARALLRAAAATAAVAPDGLTADDKRAPEATDVKRSDAEGSAAKRGAAGAGAAGEGFFGGGATVAASASEDEPSSEDE